MWADKVASGFVIWLLVDILAGAPSSVESSTVPRHKKCEAAGTKQLLKLNRVWLEQVDARELKEGVEFTLMDWGNILIKVSSIVLW